MANNEQLLGCQGISEPNMMKILLLNAIHFSKGRQSQYPQDWLRRICGIELEIDQNIGITNCMSRISHGM